MTEIPQWVSVTVDAPCPVCGRPDWCSVSADGAVAMCRRVADGGSHRIDRAGVDYWVHRLPPADAVAGERAAARTRGTAAEDATKARPPVALPGVLDRAYRAVLGALTLSQGHNQDLERRGLSPAEIIHRGYRSYVPAAAEAVVAAASRVVPAAMLARVPGFWRLDSPPAETGAVEARAAGGAPLAGMRFGSGSTGGLVVPVRDDQGRVVALKVRRTPTREGAPSRPGSKYIYVSSARHPGGVGPGAPIHVPLLPLPQTPIRNPAALRITEGELKADVAYCLSGVRTISVPGVGAWRAALPVLRTLGAHRVLLAFDADASRNPVVARALYGLAWALHTETAVEVAVETWEESNGKGIDDLLAAGHQPEVVDGPVALHRLAAVSGEASARRAREAAVLSAVAVGETGGLSPEAARADLRMRVRPQTLYRLSCAPVGGLAGDLLSAVRTGADPRALCSLLIGRRMKGEEARSLVLWAVRTVEEEDSAVGVYRRFPWGEADPAGVGQGRCVAVFPVSAGIGG